jgi:peptidoglycan glycosyltransferase
MKYYLLILLFTFNSYGNFSFFKKRVKDPIDTEGILSIYNQALFEHNKIPNELVFDGKSYTFENEINWKLNDYIEREIKRYRPDYVSVVVLDNNSGRVIAVTDYSREERSFGKRLSFSTTNPAASVFKLITAADLIENTDVNTETYFTYNGKGSTLYKYQLKDKKK